MFVISKYFYFEELGIDYWWEILVGFMIFILMLYIFFVNLNVFGVVKMDIGVVFIVIVLVFVLGCFLMGIFVCYLIVMVLVFGINVFFVYFVVIGMGISW